MAESEAPTTTMEQKEVIAEKEIAEAIEEVLAQEVDPDEDPLELLSYREIAEVYGKLSPKTKGSSDNLKSSISNTTKCMDMTHRRRICPGEL